MSYAIKVSYSYYPGTLHAPKNGFLRDDRERVIKFSSKEDAKESLERYLNRKVMLVRGKATYMVKGQYVLHHGEYAEPVYQIVNYK